MAADADDFMSNQPTSSLPFDPPGGVLTTDRLEAYMDEGRPMLNNYTRYAKIGGGQHGEVYLCYKNNPRLPPGHPERRMLVAMKSVRRENPRAERLKRLRQQRLPASPHTPVADRLNTTEAKIKKEIAIMKKCRHPHVVRLYEVIDDRMKDKIYMVMEYLGGGEVMWRDNESRPILSVDQTRRIIRDAVLGLEYLHHQGIIHRDIKPANLLWTEDRRQVKIADFGVSHFSYAQRLAAAGEEELLDDSEDPILLDDSDLTRRAGTPSFLAPEIVYEHTNPSPGLSASPSAVSEAGSSLVDVAMSQSLSTLNTRRPPITKSIDIWALGVTLYCLLFGKTPFVPDPAQHNSEWSLYNAICNNDWTVEETMGSDRIPTGGRHPTGDSEGAMVIRLLDRILEKDVSRRITLEEVKNSAWFLRDLPEPEKWLQVTSPKNKIRVTSDETSDAMTTVRFRWNWSLVSRRISSLFRRGTRESIPEDREARGVVRSDPHVKLERYKSNLPDSTTHTVPSRHVSSSKREKEKVDKGKQRAEFSVSAQKELGFAKAVRSKSIERWPNTRNPMTDAVKTSRRGSETLHVKPTNPVTPANTSQTSSHSSPAGDKPRARFALFLNSISHWRPNKYSPRATSPSSAIVAPVPSSSSLSSPGGILKTRPSTAQPQATRSQHSLAFHSVQKQSSGRVMRRSEEALRRYRLAHVQIDGEGRANGPLTPERRASSWGQGDQPMDFTEVVSLRSGDDLNEQEMTVGAGGVYTEQFHSASLPSGLSTGVAGASTTSSSRIATPPVGTANRGAFDEVEVQRLYGRPCFDEDSSTIASAVENDQDWQNGSDFDLYEGQDDDDGPRRVGGAAESDDDDDDDDDVDDDQDNAVTFSPRKRPPATHQD